MEAQHYSWLRYAGLQTWWTQRCAKTVVPTFWSSDASQLGRTSELGCLCIKLYGLPFTLSLDPPQNPWELTVRTLLSVRNVCDLFPQMLQSYWGGFTVRNPSSIFEKVWFWAGRGRNWFPRHYTLYYYVSIS